ncbi:hypothetical protein HP532_07215 [Pseudomonas sp. CrR25]|nr:hypothetical protein [Pseudomonas sp. CrR25]
MGLTVFVLAAESGSRQERWEVLMKEPKQLTKVLGETLIERTLRLCALHVKQSAYVLTQLEDFDQLPAIRVYPPCSSTKAHSILSMLHLWDGGDLLLLYSDVYYSAAAFQTIMQTHGTHFFGRGGRSAFTFKNYGELFAVRVAWADRARFVEMLQAAVTHHLHTGQQSFWILYRLMAGLPVDSRALEEALFVEIHDETDDIDFPHEVAQLVAALEKRPGWRVRYWFRLLSLWNKRRRDQARNQRDRTVGVTH